MLNEHGTYPLRCATSDRRQWKIAPGLKGGGRQRKVAPSLNGVSRRLVATESCPLFGMVPQQSVNSLRETPFKLGATFRCLPLPLNQGQFSIASDPRLRILKGKFHARWALTVWKIVFENFYWGWLFSRKLFRFPKPDHFLEPKKGKFLVLTAWVVWLSNQKSNKYVNPTLILIKTVLVENQNKKWSK